MKVWEWDLSEIFTADGCVYLARAVDFYKIGISKDPELRIKHFSTIMPVEVDIIHAFQAENAKIAEAWLHKACAPWHYKGEWFDLPPALVEFICSIGFHWHKGGAYLVPVEESRHEREWLQYFIDHRNRYPELDYLPY